MRSFSLISAAVLPVVFACENPDTHACASAFVSNAAEATSFCATYTASSVIATTAIPSLFNSACSNKSATISKACTCFVTPPTSATSSAATSTAEAVSVGYLPVSDRIP